MEDADFVSQLEQAHSVPNQKQTVLIVDVDTALNTCREYLKQHAQQLPIAICIIAPSNIIPHIGYEDPTGKDPIL